MARDESYLFREYTGGCQCGAVRFRIAGRIDHTSICYCRMCQKATGGLFGAFATAHIEHVTWTRGAPAWFESSNLARRGFCAHCGTPLTYAWNERTISFTFGAFDDPTALEIGFALEPESAHPALAALHAIPSRAIAVSPEEQGAYAALTSFQHPDHDTTEWSPRGGRND